MAEMSGRTRWRVFSLVLLVGMVGVGVMFVGLSQGALAASFSISGTSYKASADDLDADGVVQYGSVDQSSDKAHPVLVNGFRQAKLDNFCQSIDVPGLPGLGEATVQLKAPGKSGMTAQNLVIGIQDVQGDLTLSNVDIGRDAGNMDKGPANAKGKSGAFGIQADHAHISHLRQVAWSTTASTLKLNQVQISVRPGKHECF